MREFVATLYSGWKTHLAVIGVMIVFLIGIVATVYLSNVL